MKHSITIVFLFAVLATQAQLRSSSIGLRAGGLSGVSFMYVDESLTGFELIVGAKEGGAQMAGLYQKYRPIATDRTTGLFLYAGGGAHAGYVKYDEYRVYRVEGNDYYACSRKTSPVVGGDFILGVVYHFEAIPLHLGIDYKPYVELFGEKDFRIDLWDIGFSFRYAFNQ